MHDANSNGPSTQPQSAKLAYAEFLRTDFWIGVRDQRLEATRFCALCPSDTKLDVHHRIYRESWYDIRDGDLTVLCRKCHSKFHGPVLEKKRTQKTPKRLSATAQNQASSTWMAMLNDIRATPQNTPSFQYKVWNYIKATNWGMKTGAWSVLLRAEVPVLMVALQKIRERLAEVESLGLRKRAEKLKKREFKLWTTIRKKNNTIGKWTPPLG